MLLVSGCGGYNDSAKRNLASTDEATGMMLPDSTDLGDISNPGYKAPVKNSAEEIKGVPPLEFLVSGVGYTTYSLTVKANKTIKIKFSPGVQTEKIQNTGYSPQYSIMGIYISVGNETKPTEMLKNGLNGPNGGDAEVSSVLDFSNAFTKTCSKTEATCRQDVKITISKPNNDYVCLNSGWYCPWTRVQEGHPWNGTLTVQTDDTDPI